MKLTSSLSLLCMLLLWAAPASAVSNLVLAPGSGSTYVLSGQGVEGAAAVECAITYDAAVLGNPRVELGALAAGGMMAVNPNTPGTVRIAIIRTSPMSGSGTIATIAFDRKGESSGKVSVLNAKMITLDGKPLQLAVNVIAADSQTSASAVPSSQSQAVPQQAAGTPVPAPSSPQTALLPIAGGPALPKKQDDERTKQESGAGQKAQTPVTDKPAPAADQARYAKRTDELPSAATRKIYSQASVLDRFREFRGKPTMAGYTGLFEQEGMIGFRQEPKVALSDGRSRLRVSFISSSPTRTTSDIALMGARLVSLAKDPDYSNTYVLELLPARGEVQANISVPQGQVLMVFPLTVAPKVNIDIQKSGKVDEADFQAFLADRGAPGKPKYDLNGDGRRDYLDDYLFTANYLAAQERMKAPKAGK